MKSNNYKKITKDSITSFSKEVIEGVEEIILILFKDKCK